MAITRWRSTIPVILQWLHRDKPLPLLFSGHFFSTHPGKGSSNADDAGGAFVLLPSLTISISNFYLKRNNSK